MSLFQTDAWQSAWWETWGVENGLELERGWGEGRTGIYTYTYRIKGLLPVRSIEFVGSNYRKIRSTRTEYNTFSTASDAPAAAINQLKKLMDRRPWQKPFSMIYLQAQAKWLNFSIYLEKNDGWSE